MISNSWLTQNQQQIIDNLLVGKIGIIPTDTIYGLVTQWNNLSGIKKIIDLKNRDIKKSFIILVSSIKQLKQLIVWDEKIPIFLNQLLKPTSVIYEWNKKLNFNPEKFYYNSKTIVIRLVVWPWLQQIIMKTGPLIATSCNLSNQPAIIEPEKLMSWVTHVDFICSLSRQTNEVSIIIDWKTKERIR